MKLLFDQNLAPELVTSLSGEFPESAHVSECGLDKALDEVVWDHARNAEFCIVSKDSDFSDLVSVKGFPPKVIWIRRGNCSTETIRGLLQERRSVIEEFGNDTGSGLLILR